MKNLLQRRRNLQTVRGLRAQLEWFGPSIFRSNMWPFMFFLPFPLDPIPPRLTTFVTRVWNTQPTRDTDKQFSDYILLRRRWRIHVETIVSFYFLFTPDSFSFCFRNCALLRAFGSKKVGLIFDPKSDAKLIDAQEPPPNPPASCKIWNKVICP